MAVAVAKWRREGRPTSPGLPRLHKNGQQMLHLQQTQNQQNQQKRSNHGKAMGNQRDMIPGSLLSQREPLAKSQQVQLHIQPIFYT